MWNLRVKQIYEKLSGQDKSPAEYIQNQLIPYREYLRLQSNEIGIQEYIERFQVTDNRDIELTFFEKAI